MRKTNLSPLIVATVLAAFCGLVLHAGEPATRTAALVAPSQSISADHVLWHAWLPPFGLDRIGQEGAAFEADAQATADEPVNPVDLGTILVPAGWLVQASDQAAHVEVAILSRSRDLPETRLRAWFESEPQQALAITISIGKGEMVRQRMALPRAPRGVEHETVHVVLEDKNRALLWEKKIQAMLAPSPPHWPRFGASATKLRYDAPISVRDENGSFSTIDYDKGWDSRLEDVVVSLPNGSRFVFWRGSCYIPFWAGQNNTGMCYEWAETKPPKDGFVDSVEPLMDKELRYGRVEIVESTPARVHVRWRYQSCDFKYKVWGDTAVEDFYFYPDNFGSRVLTLQSAPDGDYELSEFIILTSQGTMPFSVLPANLVNIIFMDGEKRDITFPFNTSEEAAKMQSRDIPAVFRVHLQKDQQSTAVYFCPQDTKLPPIVYKGFVDSGRVVTPCYWGSHWPLARGQNTVRGKINDRVYTSPAHNSVMTWARQRPEPIREANLQTLDSLGRSRPMKVQTWAWLIGMTDTSDARLLEWARSFSTPPSLSLEGARFDSEPFAPERRAIRLVGGAKNVTIRLTPQPISVNPVFEIRGALRRVVRIILNGDELPPMRWAWDGNVLWIDATLKETAVLQLEFAE